MAITDQERWHQAAKRMVDGDQRISSRLFEMTHLNSMLEDEFFAFCQGIGLKGEWHDSFVDDYDSSVEFTKCPNDMRLTPDQQMALWAEGFHRCWLNHEDGTETYYWKDDAMRQGYRKTKPAACVTG